MNITKSILLCFTMLTPIACEETAGTGAVSGATQQATAPRNEAVLDMQGRPILIPGVCRKILIETGSIETAAQTVERVNTQNNVVRYSYGVYKLSNGNYIGAETMDTWFTERNWSPAYRSSYRERVEGISRVIRRGDYPSSARCTDGSDIVEDTGVRIEYTRPNTGGGLIGAVISGVSGALRNAGNASTSGAAYTAAPTAGTGAQPESSNQGVTRDGSGWVKVDGRTVGRAWVSYGYNISCSNGYNSGYGSNSALGGSFKADVGSMDEAVGVLLAACRR